MSQYNKKVYDFLFSKVDEELSGYDKMLMESINDMCKYAASRQLFWFFETKYPNECDELNDSLPTSEKAKSIKRK
jgi:hypothetical protein